MQNNGDFSNLTSQSKITTGKKAELVAIDFLNSKGWNIITTNYKAHSVIQDTRQRYGEIDIIAELLHEKTPLLAAFEVKYRKSHRALPYTITPNQQQRITNAFLLFLASNPCYNKYDLRFDVLLINKHFVVSQHITNAWLVNN